jgi:homoserine kinase type II
MSVYTPVSEAELHSFLARYAIGSLVSYAAIQAGLQNTNYFVTTTQGDYVLTLFEQHNAAELSYFMQLMQHWSNAGLPIAQPIATQHGTLLSPLNAKPASLVTRLAGVHPAQPTITQCAAIGQTLAHMHNSAQTFTPYRAPDRGHAWRMLTATQLIKQLDAADAVLLQTEIAFQPTIPWRRLSQGTIHADLFRDNALLVGNTISGVLDLYFACNDSLLYDLAIVVNDWCANADGSLDLARMSACINAYQALRPWQALETTHWLGVLRAAALRFYLSRLYDSLQPCLGDGVLRKDPAEFRAKLVWLQQYES